MEAAYNELPPERAARKAQTGAWLGILAMTLALFGWCTCQTTTLAAVIPAILAVWFGRSAGESDDPEARAYANVAMVSGAISGVYLILILTFLALYLGLYAVMIGLMVADGAF
ncbi:MAG: hypothetical protein JXX28_15400 [Deltaproteobacteria bacterium]|nr:hypothetical protein [Deltaproteobacteria bacterium]